jgi:DNA-binding NarL/FixJ family response regulator
MTTLLAERPTLRRDAASPLDRLSERELEILGLISDGLSNTAIAARLSVMERTIESHIARMFAKLDLMPGAEGNRRVLAVLMYLRSRS